MGACAGSAWACLVLTDADKLEFRGLATGSQVLGTPDHPPRAWVSSVRSMASLDVTSLKQTSMMSIRESSKLHT